MEIWKDIPDYEGLYQVSNCGNVKSSARKLCNHKGCHISKEKKLKNRLCGLKDNNYLCVALYNNGRKEFKIHQLVAIAFLNHKVSGHKIVVDHINNDKLDNRVENLQLISQRENSSKDKKNKTSKYTGVCLNKARNKWTSHIRISNKLKNLGSFTNEYEANLAYQNKLKEL